MKNETYNEEMKAKWKIKSEEIVVYASQNNFQ